MSARPQSGILCTVAVKAGDRARGGNFYSSVCALAFYSAVWGALCSMATISTAGIAPLALGGCLAFVFPLLPRKKRWQAGALAASLVLAALLFVLQWEGALEGCKLLLNRLFAASEARQAYTYTKFSLTAGEGGQSAIRVALMPLGILVGLVCGAASRYRLRSVMVSLFGGLAAVVAYLGISPSGMWCALLSAALLASLVENPVSGNLPARLMGFFKSLLPLALACGLVLWVAPGEDARLSAWDERARDALALQTVAYAEQWQPEPEPEKEQVMETKDFYQEEDTAGDLGGDERSWGKPISVALAILLFALLLFLPAILSDWQKRRQAKNRMGMEDPDNNAAIRAAFLYALRWMRMGGLQLANRPFSSYARDIEAVLSPQARDAFEAVLPLWQEAAYSPHAMDDEQREAMRQFAENTRQAVWEGLRKKDRLRAKYVYAL